MSVDEEGFLTELPPIPEDEFCVYGTVHAHAPKADALEKVYIQTTRLAASEPGTIYYCICRDTSDPTMFHFFERYTGKEAFDVHNAQPVIRKLVEVDRFIRGVKAVFCRPVGMGVV